MKEKKKFVCGECGYESVKWMGCCPSCGSWNTLVEVNDTPAAVKSVIGSNGAHAEAIKNIDEKTVRLMDVMEMDIRKTPGNEAFRMDGMIFSLSAEVNVYSSYGSSVSIKRNNMYR